jgi:hypothetical protein
MDDLIVVRCNRDVSKSSLISHVTRTSSAYFETDGVERGERSLGDPGALADSEVWVLTDNGQMLIVADVNQVLPVKLIETASGYVVYSLLLYGLAYSRPQGTYQD